MKFTEFRRELKAAREALEVFEGDDNWPGLSKYDRAYGLGEDALGWQCLVLVYASDLSTNGPLKLALVRWSRQLGPELTVNDLTSEQLFALARIKAEVERWTLGLRDHLPPSTCSRIVKPADDAT